VFGDGLERLESPHPSIISAGFKEDTTPCSLGSWAIENKVDHTSLSHIDDKIQEPLARLLRQVLDRFAQRDEDLIRFDTEHPILQLFWNNIILPGCLILGVIYFFSRVSGLPFSGLLGFCSGIRLVCRRKHIVLVTKLLFLLTLLFWRKDRYFWRKKPGILKYADVNLSGCIEIALSR
jgi:hypothetical protein